MHWLGGGWSRWLPATAPLRASSFLTEPWPTSSSPSVAIGFWPYNVRPVSGRPPTWAPSRWLAGSMRKRSRCWRGEITPANHSRVALDELRVFRAAALVGLASEAIEIGAAYARDREAFGLRIGAYQAVAHPLADTFVAKDGAQLLIWKACWALDEGLPLAPAFASMAFVFAAETAYAAAQHSLHLHGGYGFTVECDIQLYYRRAKAWVTAFADPDRELDVTAGALVRPSSDWSAGRNRWRDRQGCRWISVNHRISRRFEQRLKPLRPSTSPPKSSRRSCGRATE